MRPVGCVGTCWARVQIWLATVGLHASSVWSLGTLTATMTAKTTATTPVHGHSCSMSNMFNHAVRQCQRHCVKIVGSRGGKGLQSAEKDTTVEHFLSMDSSVELVEHQVLDVQCFLFLSLVCLTVSRGMVVGGEGLSGGRLLRGIFFNRRLWQRH